MLVSLDQMDALDAVLKVRENTVTFREISEAPVKVERSKKGHFMVKITDFPKEMNTEPNAAAPKISTKSIEVWQAEANTSSSTTTSFKKDFGIMNKKMKKQVDEWIDSLQQEQRATWKAVRQATARLRTPDK